MGVRVNAAACTAQAPCPLLPHSLAALLGDPLAAGCAPPAPVRAAPVGALVVRIVELQPVDCPGHAPRHADADLTVALRSDSGEGD